MLKVVLTGGPCAGKTTALAVLQEKLSDRGYKVFSVPEIPTEIILSGVTIPLLGLERFEEEVIKRQLAHEDWYINIAETLEKEGHKIIVLFDRGLLDIKTYIPELAPEFLRRHATGQNNLLGRYDVVLHLTTAANGAEEFYTTENNQARSESPELARELDEVTKKSWLGHNKLRIIDNSTDFRGKMGESLGRLSAAEAPFASAAESRPRR